MASTPIQSPSSRKKTYESYLQLGRWTVDNSESRISRIFSDSPRRSILKGSQTPNRLPAPLFNSRQRHQTLEGRRVSFAPDTQTSVRLFSESEAAGRTVTSPVPGNSLPSSVFDEVSPLSARLDDNTPLSRLSGSPSDRRRRRMDMFGSPPGNIAGSKRRFGDLSAGYDEPHSRLRFEESPSDLTQYLSIQHQKGPRRLFADDMSIAESSHEESNQLAQEQTHHNQHITDTRWRSQTPLSDEPMQLTQEMGAGGEALQRSHIFMDDDEEEMQITQEVDKRYASPASTTKSPARPMKVWKSPMSGTHSIHSPARPLTKSPAHSVFSPYRSFYLHETLKSPLEKRVDGYQHRQTLTGDISIGSDLMSMHESQDANILDEEFPQTYDSFTEESTISKNMSLSEFLQYAGITFQDDLTTGSKRRTSRFDASSEGPVTLVEQAIVSVNVMPELDFYRLWCKDLEEIIQRDRTALRQIDEEMSLNNPQFFAEYLEGDVHFRNQMEARFKVLKEFVHYKAKRDWYNSRQEQIKKVNDILQSNLQKLQIDRGSLDDFESRLSKCARQLLDFRDDLTTNLNEARLKEALYHKIDHKQLAELENEIEDQRASIQDFQREKELVESEMLTLKEKESILNERELQLKEDITKAEKTKRDNQCVTEADLLNAKDHYKACSGAIRWKLEDQSETAVNIKIDDDLDVVLDRDKLHRKETDAVLIRMLESRDQELGPFAELIHGLQVMFNDTWDESEIMQEIAIYWNRVKIIRREIALVQRRFWIEYTALDTTDNEPDMRGVGCSIVVFSYMGQTKFTVCLQIRAKDILAWPMIDFTNLTVKLEYGHVTQGELDVLVRESLKENGMVGFAGSLRSVLDKVQPPVQSVSEE